MAKVENGPLVASISGSLGDVTFLNTKFGQVVQTKPVPRVYDTPAALATKDRFRKAMAWWGRMDPAMRRRLISIADDKNKTPSQQWVKAWYNWNNGADWSYPDTNDNELVLTVTEAEVDFPFIRLHYDESRIPNGTFFFGFYHVNREVDPDFMQPLLGQLNGSPNSVIWTAPPPFEFIYFPVGVTGFTGVTSGISDVGYYT